LLHTSRILAASMLVFGLASAGLTDSDSATSAEKYKAMSMKDDLAHCSPPFGSQMAKVGEEQSSMPAT